MNLGVFLKQVSILSNKKFNQVSDDDIKTYIEHVFSQFNILYHKQPDLLLAEDIAEFCTVEMIQQNTYPRYLCYETYALREKCNNASIDPTLDLKPNLKPEADAKLDPNSDIKRVYERCHYVECRKVKCRRCKSVNIFQYSLQTRSADEPMSEFGECFSCQYTWRIA